ncbi:hypothetical protein F0U60_00385 [Archangium minus]|uniref:Uncharacterized protein n=1 Tax=Archangium minus TaxID=83450 RepID=A0ABY9WFZ7_9BACT|nr:hypothetical protein F0U60_00385 [Archangium minus]
MMRTLGVLAAGWASLVETEMRHLPMLGHMAEMHLSAGSRDGGVCLPELVISLTTMGDPLIPRPEAYSPRGPAGSLGVTLAPLRYCGGGGLEVSLFGLDMAYETSEGSSGTALQMGLLGASFDF